MEGCQAMNGTLLAYIALAAVLLVSPYSRDAPQPSHLFFF
jgi:hypothetical protein